jgi:murein DD-endopeptidase MepM/ murein hydrolase activator NlpD
MRAEGGKESSTASIVTESESQSQFASDGAPQTPVPESIALVRKRHPIALLLVLVLAAGTAGSGSTARNGGATSQAYAIKVIVPGQGGAATTPVAAPKDSVAFGNASAYPSPDVVSWGSSVASASASPGETATASASAEVSTLSLFGGEVTATSVRGRVEATANTDGATGDFDGSGVATLVVQGQAVSSDPGAHIPLGDWGSAIVLAEGSAPADTSFRGNVTALDIRLTVDHGGLPAGTQILVGYAEAAVTSPDQTSTTTGPTTPVPAPRSTKKQPKPPEQPTGGPPIIRQPPVGVKPKLTKGRYVFPVYGPCSFTSTFAAPRADTGWHHGEDIFAALGAPLLAVADGTVFSVGWNDVGGYRLWLRDRQGNQFYYAHLSAFSPLAVNGAQVKAGDVVGFMGNSGDAQGTPYHLHFEVHPVQMLYLGYDGVIPPYPLLVAWRRLDDIQFPDGTGWAPAVPAGAQAPKPGAIVLQVTDISVASGLRPGSLARAFVAPVSSEGDGALIRAFTPPAIPDGGLRQGLRPRGSD